MTAAFRAPMPTLPSVRTTSPVFIMTWVPPVGARSMVSQSQPLRSRMAMWLRSDWPRFIVSLFLSRPLRRSQRDRFFGSLVRDHDLSHNIQQQSYTINKFLILLLDQSTLLRLRQDKTSEKVVQWNVCEKGREFLPVGPLSSNGVTEWEKKKRCVEGAVIRRGEIIKWNKLINTKICINIGVQCKRDEIDDFGSVGCTVMVYATKASVGEEEKDRFNRGRRGNRSRLT